MGIDRNRAERARRLAQLGMSCEFIVSWMDGRMFPSSCFGIQDFSFCDFQISAPPHAFCLCQPPALSGMRLTIPIPYSSHPLRPSPCERRKESQHELLIFPPLRMYLNSVNRKEGDGIPWGSWTMYPIEMLGASLNVPCKAEVPRYYVNLLC